MWARLGWRRPEQVQLRSGLKLVCSSDKEDIRTLIEVFVRKTYGEIAPGALVVDIGANIGLFAVYAVEQGAARVLAYEPCPESTGVIGDNIELNRLQDRVQVRRVAVSRSAGDTVRFAVRSSRDNQLALAPGQSEATIETTTTTLRDIFSDNGISHIDLLKMDCEGAENDIILHSPVDVWKSISAVRLECHGNDKAIIEHLTRHGYRLTAPPTEESGRCMILFFENVTAGSAPPAAIGMY